VSRAARYDVRLLLRKKILLRGTAGKRQGSVPVIKSQPIREREMQGLYSEICRVRKSFARQVTAKLIWL
jgi:hypothetical protein